MYGTQGKSVNESSYTLGPVEALADSESREAETHAVLRAT